MGRTRCRVLLGACLAACSALSSAALAQDSEQYALLAPRRPSQSSEAASEPTAPTTSAASEMTLQPPVPEAPPAEMPEPAEEVPLAPKGFTGPSPFGRSLAQDDFLPIPDRWRVGFPTGYRPDVGGFGRYWDPYHQNVLKGDYPFWGNDKFIVITATSDTLVETRRLPTPSGVSSRVPNSIDFFGNGRQYLVNQNFILSMSIFKGDAGYRPRDW